MRPAALPPADTSLPGSDRPVTSSSVDETRREQERKPEGARKQPRKVSPRYLENAALHYLKRYAATASQLKRVLVRRVDRSLRVHGGERTEALGWVDALVDKLVRNGLINDGAYAGMKAQSLRASGRSARVIAQKLRMKGVPAELVQQKLAEASAELSEEEAARIWARKKRLGPFRRDAEARQEHRQRDLAALARAGFSFAVARKIIDAPE
jgi:regulatory protein